MEIISHIFLTLLGILMVLRGADRLTDGAVVLARKFKMPEIIIGLTIVAFGTSMPELCVSMVSASSDMAVGNVIGSNIFNVLLILGVCSIITPIKVSKSTINRDIPFSIIATVMLIVMLIDGVLSLIDGIIMVLVFCLFQIYSIKKAKAENKEIEIENGEDDKKSILNKPWLAIPIGLLFLVYGSDLFVFHASHLALGWGMSEAAVGLIILGGGTSMPELATSAVAAFKGRTSMALGNVIGSCVFNILLILGLTSIVRPLSPDGISLFDIGLMIIGSLLMWIFARTKYTLERWEGSVLTLVFIAYITSLLIL